MIGVLDRQLGARPGVEHHGKRGPVAERPEEVVGPAARRERRGEIGMVSDEDGCRPAQSGHGRRAVPAPPPRRPR